jgi:hypothetical protein
VQDDFLIAINFAFCQQRVREAEAQHRMLFYTVGVQGALKFKS